MAGSSRLTLGYGFAQTSDTANQKGYHGGCCRADMGWELSTVRWETRAEWRMRKCVICARPLLYAKAGQS